VRYATWGRRGEMTIAKRGDRRIVWQPIDSISTAPAPLVPVVYDHEADVPAECVLVMSAPVFSSAPASCVTSHTGAMRRSREVLGGLPMRFSP
jgi:hypothetical protein